MKKEVCKSIIETQKNSRISLVNCENGINWKNVLTKTTELVVPNLIAHDVGSVKSFTSLSNTLLMFNKTVDDDSFTVIKCPINITEKKFNTKYSIAEIGKIKTEFGDQTEHAIALDLSKKITKELNEEFLKIIDNSAVMGSTNGKTKSEGIFDFSLDCNPSARWTVEKLQRLLGIAFEESMDIGDKIKVGDGNILICSRRVANALSLFNTLETKRGRLLIKDENFTGFVGRIQGKLDMYVSKSYSGLDDYITIGYIGNNVDTGGFDAGLFFCAFGLIDAQYDNNHQIIFSTKRDIIANSWFDSIGNNQNSATINNEYFRKVEIKNLDTII